jgi:hypothetical protein
MDPREIETPIDPVKELVSSMNNMSDKFDKSISRLITSLSQGSRGVRSRPFRVTPGLSGDALKNSEEYLSSIDTSNKSIQEYMSDISYSLDKYFEYDHRSDRLGEDEERTRWRKLLEAETNTSESISDVVRSQPSALRGLGDSIGSTLKGIYANTMYPIFKDLASGVLQNAIEVRHMVKDTYRDSMNKKGFGSIDEKSIEKYVKYVQQSSNRTIKNESINSSMDTLINANLSPDEAINMNYNVKGRKINLAKFMAQLNDIGLAIDQDEFEYALANDKMEDWIERQGARQNVRSSVSESTRMRNEDFVNKYQFRDDPSGNIRAKMQTENLLVGATKGRSAQEQEALFQYLDTFNNIKDVDQLHQLGVLGGKNGGKLLQMLTQPGGVEKNRDEYMKVLIDALPEIQSKFKDLNPITREELAKGLGISSEDINAIARARINTQGIKGLNDTGAGLDVIDKTAENNDKKHQSELARGIGNWIDKNDLLRGAVDNLANVMTDPTYGPFVSYLGAIGISGGIKGLFTKGASIFGGIWKSVLGKGAVSAATKAATTGASTAATTGGGGLLGLITRNPAVASKALGGAGGLALAGYDAYKGVKNAKEYTGRDDTQAKISSGIGGFLGGGDGGVKGALGGMAKGAMIGSMFGPVGTAIGAAAGGVLGAVGGKKISKFLDGSIDYFKDTSAWVSKNFNAIVENLGAIGKWMFVDLGGAYLKTLLAEGKYLFVEAPYNTFKMASNLILSAGDSLMIGMKTAGGFIIKGIMNILDPIASRLPGVSKLWSAAKSGVDKAFDTTEDKKRRDQRLSEVREYGKKQIDSQVAVFDPIKDAITNRPTLKKYQALNENEKSAYKRDQALNENEKSAYKKDQASLQYSTEYDTTLNKQIAQSSEMTTDASIDTNKVMKNDHEINKANLPEQTRLLQEINTSMRDLKLLLIKQQSMTTMNPYSPTGYAPPNTGTKSAFSMVGGILASGLK